MDKHFSLYLDLVRFIAALLVVMTHFSQQGYFGPPAPDDLMLGREAVIVFFILSGYVIAWSCAERALTLRQYVVARSARIYSVALPLVLAAFALGLLALRAGIEVESGYQLHKPWVYLPLHLLFVGQLWTLSETPPWMTPYWSLGYEVWYYILFGVAWYARGVWRAVLLAVVLMAMGPKLLLLLPVWLAGAALARSRPLALSPALARGGALATLAALLAFKLLGLDIALRTLGIALWPFPSLPLGSADRYLADYVVCLIILLHFCCMRAAPLPSLQRLALPIRTLAGYTFTLYLVHSLVMGVWGQFFAPKPASVSGALLLAGCIALATYACGFITEHRRGWVRDRFDALYGLSARRLA